MLQQQLIAPNLWLCGWRNKPQGGSYRQFISDDHFNPHLDNVCVKVNQTHSLMVRAGKKIRWDKAWLLCPPSLISVEQLFRYSLESWKAQLKFFVVISLADRNVSGFQMGGVGAWGHENKGINAKNCLESKKSATLTYNLPLLVKLFIL